MNSFFEKDSQNSQAYTAFTQVEASLKRAKYIRTLIFVAVFILALWASAYVGEVDLAEFIEGLPSFFNYFQQTLPTIDAQTFQHDIADWYWGIGKWLRFLWDTVLIAFLATLFGFVSAFLLCFAASRNLNKNY
ncbi:MAG: hypothetical protein PVH43_11290, partial [Desulfobacterales bacterium]